jgi:hypothetical protein|tara:strand:+ start:107 stop:424 length:318 start_codon:yes stop_codon:yes gene_type:complete
MGDFNQDAFQRLMMIPGVAAGFGMSGAGKDASFQDYLNERMMKDSQKRATEMQERRAMEMQDMMSQGYRNREFGERSAVKATNRIGEMMGRRMFPQIGALTGAMY